MLISYTFCLFQSEEVIDHTLSLFLELASGLVLLPYFLAKKKIQPSTDSNDLSVIEAKLAWVVHIIAAILKIKQSTSCR